MYKKENKKVSVILIHYNQMEYIYNALNSVLNQTYNNIQLIIADDSSTDFDKKKIEEYIEEKNIKKYEYHILVNKKNIGTVKNLNNALTKCDGDYLLIFGADDMLYDENVIENYVKAFKNQDSDVSIVFSQCYMMDNKLEKVQSKYVKKEESIQFNKMNSQKQFYKLLGECFAAMGACMLDLNILKENNCFDERFKYIEDWTYFLETTKRGYRMIYTEFDGLKHRDGGISHSTEHTPIKISFFTELNEIIEIYAFPNFINLTTEFKNQILSKYIHQKEIIEKKVTDNNESKIIKVTDYKESIRITRNHIVIVSILLILLIELNSFYNKQYEKIFALGIYFLLAIILLFIIKVMVIMLKKAMNKLSNHK